MVKIDESKELTIMYTVFLHFFFFLLLLKTRRGNFTLDHLFIIYKPVLIDLLISTSQAFQSFGNIINCCHANDIGLSVYLLASVHSLC